MSPPSTPPNLNGIWPDHGAESFSHADRLRVQITAPYHVIIAAIALQTIRPDGSGKWHLGATIGCWCATMGPGTPQLSHLQAVQVAGLHYSFDGHLGRRAASLCNVILFWSIIFSPQHGHNTKIYLKSHPTAFHCDKMKLSRAYLYCPLVQSKSSSRPSFP